MQHKLLTRRNLISFAGIGAASLALPSKAFASTAYAGEIEVTKSVACAIADNIRLTFRPDTDCRADSAIPLYDPSGAQCGYVVLFTSDGECAGYVVLDKRVDGLASDFSIGKVSHLPFYPRTFSSKSAMKSLGSPIGVITYGDYIYGCMLPWQSEILLNTGESTDIPQGLTENDTILDPFTVSEYYATTISDLQEYVSWPDFYGYDDFYIRLATNRYACFVTACYALADYWYGYSWDSTDIDAEKYNSIWSYTGTSQIGTIGDAVLGGTEEGAGAAGFASYIRDRHGRNLQYTAKERFYSGSQFTDAIDHGRGCLLNINANPGHTVTVEGYCSSIDPQGVKRFYIITYDGWDDVARFLSFISYSGDVTVNDWTITTFW